MFLPDGRIMVGSRNSKCIVVEYFEGARNPISSPLGSLEEDVYYMVPLRSRNSKKTEFAFLIKERLASLINLRTL